MTLGCFKILENVVQEVSNRYSPFFSIAEAISVIAGTTPEASQHSVTVKIKSKTAKTNSKKNKEIKQLLSDQESLKKIVSPEPSVKNNKPEKASKKDRDRDLVNDIKNDFEEDGLVVDYSREEEFFMTEIYGSHPLDYVALFYGGQGAVKFKDKEEYASLTTLSDAEDESMSSLEAEATIVKVQYAMTMNNRDEIDFKFRKKLSNWFTFNSVLGMLYHRLHGVTDEVNYSRVY